MNCDVYNIVLKTFLKKYVNQSVNKINVNGKFK